MNDPAAMNDMMRTMRNPNLRREMMRNTDRMMSNIESMPGGFNELRKLYRNIQEPMENAMEEMQSEQSTISSTSASSNNNNNGTANTSALPNPWAASTGASQNNNPFGSLMGGAGQNSNPFGSLMGGQNNNMFGGQNLTEMMNNPAVQSILNNPQLMNQIMSSMFSGPNNGTQAGLPQNNLFGASNNNLFGNTNSNLLGQNNNNNNNNNNNMFNSMMMNPALMNQILGGMNNTNSTAIPQSTANPLISGPNPFGSPFLYNPALMSLMFGGPSTASLSTTSPSLSSSQNQNNTSVSNNNNANDNNNLNNNDTNNNNNPSLQPTQSTSQSAIPNRYTIQLTQLNEMGFLDNVKNLQILEQTQGNVERALELLFSS